MKVFEQPEDRKKEHDVIKKIAGSNKFKKLERSSLDYEIIGKAYIEIKCYNIKHDQYKNTIVSIQKLVKMQLMSKRLPTYLFIVGSTNDIEFIGYVNTQKFKTFKT